MDTARGQMAELPALQDLRSNAMLHLTADDPHEALALIHADDLEKGWSLTYIHTYISSDGSNAEWEKEQGPDLEHGCIHRSENEATKHSGSDDT